MSALLGMLTLFPLVSCGEAAVQAVTETAAQSSSADTTAAETTAVTADLPDTDWNGRTFTVLGTDNTTYPQFSNLEICSDALTGDIVNDAVYNRNSALEEKYDVKFAKISKDNWGSTEEVNTLTKAVASGDTTYDLAFMTLDKVGSVVSGGSFMDMSALQYVDYTKPYWNSEVNASVSIDGKLFFTTSDYSLQDKRRTYILVYNRDLAKNYNLTGAVDLVKNGGWTTEVMQTWSETVSADLDGDGKRTDADCYGVVMDSYNAFQAFITGCENNIITKGDNDKLALTANNEHMISSIDKIIALTCNTDNALFCNDFSGKVSYDFWSVSTHVFDAGNALFNAVFTCSLQKFSADTEFDYGVLPFPKFDETQDYYYDFPDIIGVMVFGVPKSAGDPAFTGFMLEALSAASTDTSLYAYYQVSCKDKYTYDQDSADMLDLIFEHISYDLGTIFSFGGINSILNDKIPSQKKNNFASLYAKVESKALTDIDKLETAVADY